MADVIGSRCVVGHRAHLEGCVVGADCLIGSGSIGPQQGEGRAWGCRSSSALVTEGMVVPSGQIALGVPAALRPAHELDRWIAEAVLSYRASGQAIQRRAPPYRLNPLLLGAAIGPMEHPGRKPVQTFWDLTVDGGCGPSRLLRSFGDADGD
jgi:hypothetical protein